MGTRVIGYFKNTILRHGLCLYKVSPYIFYTVCNQNKVNSVYTLYQLPIQMSSLDIYLVEDNPLLALGLKQIIKSLGHHVCGFASSYEQAIFDLKTLKPDLVITDIMLEGLGTGVDLGHYLNKYLNIPFIYQSSVSISHVICEAYATQPEAYLVKPVGRYDLGVAISAFGE